MPGAVIHSPSQPIEQTGPRPRAAVAGLSPRSRRIVVAFAEAMFADEDYDGALVPAPPEICTRAAYAFDATLEKNPHLRMNFTLLTFVLDCLPLFIIGAFSRMTSLPLERRIEYLEALETSRIGLFSMLLVVFKIPTTIGVYEYDPELHSTGFDRPSTTARRKLPTIGAMARGGKT